MSGQNSGLRYPLKEYCRNHTDYAKLPLQEVSATPRSELLLQLSTIQTNGAKGLAMVPFFQSFTSACGYAATQPIRFHRLGLELLLEVLLMLAPASLDRMAQIGEYLRDAGDLKARLPGLVEFIA